ncbi:MAG: homogentisate 1,2-dioxygenase [Candidatus Marinimicrobia bacterium]|nr:homogentisate 1,2-dioxygenase [Candidatus Neomarinimicrobiota bacterium]
MPFYQKRGVFPNKRHIQFKDNGGNLYWEELISREGFSSIYSNVYHKNPPTVVNKIGDFNPLKIEAWTETHRHHHLTTHKLDSSGDAISARIPLFFNSDCVLSKAHVNSSMDDFYRNGHFDEVIFVHNGSAVIKSNFGDLTVSSGDQVVIPRGVIWKMDVMENLKLFIVESSGPVETPGRYRNRHGQLLEHSPFSERDIRTPEFVEPQTAGPVNVNVRLNGGHQTYEYTTHPCDIVGWDGYYFPWVFNIKDFMPITGKVHQPPPVHQVFETSGLVICNFVPRLFDYHPEAIPAPYAHSNVDSDEILYYVEGNFMSRKGMEEGSITFHPSGLPHGPQPGKIEESFGTKETSEYAVMVDTFKPLKITTAAKAVDDGDYPSSWLEL